MKSKKPNMRTRKGSAYIYGDPTSHSYYKQMTEEEMQAMKDRLTAKRKAEEYERRTKEQNFVKIPDFVREFVAQQPNCNILKQEQSLFCKVGQWELLRKSSKGEEQKEFRDYYQYTYKEGEEIIATVLMIKSNSLNKRTGLTYSLHLIKKNRKVKNTSIRLSVKEPIIRKLEMAAFFAVGYLARDINSVMDSLLKAALFVDKYGTNSSKNCLENEYGVYTGWLLLPVEYITEEVLEFVKTESVATYEALRVKLELAVFKFPVKLCSH